METLSDTEHPASRKRRPHGMLGATAAGALLMLAGCAPSGPASGHTVLAADLSPLRAQFNADAGKVRAIFLAAPT